MEIFLAIVVATAVVFFGALISIGNERQRRAIDALHQAYEQWALKDLQIKRETISKDVKIDNPLNWLNTVGSNACGYDLGLQVIELFEDPDSLLCTSSNTRCQIIFTLLSPSELQKLKGNKRHQLGRLAGHNPLLSLPRNATNHELSMLNNGILFDLELELAWTQLTGKKLKSTNCLWMYKYS